MIAPDSASYPVTGAALAAGVEPGVACRWWWARRCVWRGEVGAQAAEDRAWSEGVRRFGPVPMLTLVWRLSEAVREGRLYAPEWGRP